MPDLRRLAPGTDGSRVTATGYGLLAGVVALVVAAAVTNYPELAVLACAGAVVAVGAAVVLLRPLRLTATTALAPAVVARGESAVLSLTVRNAGARGTGPLSLSLPVVALAGGPSAAADAPALVVSLEPVPGRATRTVAVPLPTARRGAVQIGPALVRRTDPLGLVERSVTVGTSVALRVRPRVTALAPVLSRRTSHPDGSETGAVSDSGVSFHALREYVPGDDPRHVHWRSTARTGRLVVRRYVDPAEPNGTVLLDLRASAYRAGQDAARNVDEDAGFELAVDVAASVCVASARSRFPVRLVSTGGMRTIVRGGRSDVTTLLDALTLVEPGGGSGDSGGSGGSALAGALGALGKGAVGTLTVVTGSADLGQLADLSGFTRRFEQVVVVRVDVPGDRGDSGSLVAADGRMRVVQVGSLNELTGQWPAAGTDPVVRTGLAADSARAVRT